MYAIFLDGESKTGKTTVGAAIEADLAKDHKVLRTLSGSFFRRLTVLVLEMHGPVADVSDLGWLEKAVRDAIQSREAYDEDRDWSSIHSQEVDALVSYVGQLDITQQAAKEWWPIMADSALAQGVEVLIVDGRNPRAKSAAWRAEHHTPIALDLCVYCDPRVAAERYVHSGGNAIPSEAQIAEAQQKIEQRRELDRTRPVAPYVEPSNQLLFDSGVSGAGEVIAQAFADEVADPPRVIRFDTTHSPLEVNQLAAGQLARAALDYLKT